MANNIQITYTPFFRDDILNNEINIPTPIIEIKGYTPKYNFSIQHEKELTPNEQHVSLNKETIPIVKQEKGLDQATNPYAKKTSNGKFKSRDEFKSIMSNVYKKLLKEKGINTEYAKALVAQDALESAYGTKLAGKFNYGGIKGKGTISKTREVINGKEIFINDSFKDFNSIEDYANYKIKLLSNKRYNAFSGNLKDFANKVHKGGYATDPNYTKVLNKMIASAKYGGILKYQEGGIAQSKNWVKQWLFNRRDKLKQNAKQIQKFPVPITGTFIYNNAVRNMDITNAFINPDKVPNNADGVYYPGIRNIYLRNNSPSVAVHEWTHSTRPTIQSDTIKQIIEKTGNAIYDQNSITPDAYLDNPNEIYSRLMQLRHDLNIDPKHVFTIEEINDLKNKNVLRKTLNTPYKNNSGFISTTFDKKDNIINTEFPEYKLQNKNATTNFEYNRKNTHDILNRYSSHFIKQLLNEVASNKNTKTITYAQRGVKFPEIYDFWKRYYDRMRPEKINSKSQNTSFPIKILLNSPEINVPTIENLAEFTKSYEDFKEKPYILTTTDRFGKKKSQKLIGYGFADKDLIKKYGEKGMPKKEADKIIISKLTDIYKGFNKEFKWFNDLDENVKLALVDIAYNGRGINEISEHSPNLLKMLNEGITDPNQLVTEMNHSKNSNGWLGVRSAARRAMALGEYNWNPEKVDKYGRALLPNVVVDVQDWKASPYYNKY